MFYAFLTKKVGSITELFGRNKSNTIIATDAAGQAEKRSAHSIINRGQQIEGLTA